MLSSNVIVARSPSKLNVFLEVLGKRSDGYHELETVMLRTDLSDSMRFTPREDGKLKLTLVGAHRCIDAAKFPLDESNLILKAAIALRELTGCQTGAEIEIAKNIPMQAGMGGASGNAATTLLVLNKLWNLDLDKAVLHQIAAKLGSDINFLLSGYRAAMCRGRGEQVVPIPVGGCLDFVVFIPKQGNSTADIFRRLDLSSERKRSSQIISEISGGCSRRISMCLFNRLTAPAMGVNPNMARLIQRSLQCSSVPLLMSGSGSTCFVPVENQREAGRVQKKVLSHTNILTRRLRV